MACYSEYFPTDFGRSTEIIFTEVVQSADDFTKKQMQEQMQQDLQELEYLAEEYANKGFYTPYEIPNF